jgi:predicted aspartyl protease
LAWLALDVSKGGMRSTRGIIAVFVPVILLITAGFTRGAVALDSLGLYLTKNGYGGAPLVHLGNFYHLPIHSNGKPGNLLVDTGGPMTLLYRSSLGQLNLAESKTTEHVNGAFGRGHDVYGETTIKALSAGNCLLTNVPVAVASDSSITRPISNGVLGLRELIKFGAILDFQNHLLYLRSSRPGEKVGSEIKAILSRQGYTAIPLVLRKNHLYAVGAVNGVPCHFIVDTGSYLTALDARFAARTKLNVGGPRLIGQGLGGSSPEGMTRLSSLRIGDYEIKNGSASVAPLNPAIFEAHSDTAGFLGAEYLAINRAIFDFVSGTMFLRPPGH